MDSSRSFADSLRAIPERAELVVGDTRTSAPDLLSAAARFARRLRAFGVGAGVTVGWWTDDVPEVVIGRIAVHLLGATFLGVPASAVLEVRREAIALVGDGVLVVAPALRTEVAELAAGRARVLTLDDLRDDDVRDDGASHPPPGSDGEPSSIAVRRLRRAVGGGAESVAHTSRELTDMLVRWRAEIASEPVRHVVLPSLIGHGGDIALATLLAGGTVFHNDLRDRPSRILAVLERTAATHLSVSWELLAAICREPAAAITDLSALRRVLIVGPPPPEGEVTRAVEILGPIIGRGPDLDDPPDDSATWHRALAGAVAAADATVGELTATQVRRFTEAVRHAARLSMLRALQRRGVLTDPGRSRPADRILAEAAVAPEHHDLITRWLHLLVEHGIVTADVDGFAGAIDVDAETVTGAWDRAATAWTGTLGSGAFVDYLRRNAERLPELITGEQQAVLLLFSDGRTDTAEAVYRETVAARYLTTAVATLLSEIAAHRPGDRPLRVLEVGAGTGATTEAVVTALLATGRGGLDYQFTDISGFFLETARDQLALPSWVRFGVLDVDADLGRQGYRPHSVDVVLAAGVLNNARNTDASVGRLVELLVPGGWLLVTEPTREHDEMLISQAFMMTPADDERRRAGTSFLSVEGWHGVLERAGTPCWLTAPPDDHPLAGLGQRLFVVRT